MSSACQPIRTNRPLDDRGLRKQKIGTREQNPSLLPSMDFPKCRYRGTAAKNTRCHCESRWAVKLGANSDNLQMRERAAWPRK
jgi:hypothetical protein